jgi:2-polyprenyl-6-methoxyphenol hydroxylase-like FAD-dependent oxidoreductase
MSDPVLVVGAGPVGLTAATELLRRGVAVHCVDRGPGPSGLTKALVIWPRTWEVLDELGAGPAIAARGLMVDRLRYYSDGSVIADIGFNERTRPVMFPQPEVESVLLAAFGQAGGVVRWSTQLVTLEQDGTGVRALLREPDGTESWGRYSFVVGADGASSTVRGLLEIPFEGATYPNTFVLADARVTGGLQHDASHYYCSPRGILVLAGLPNGRFRVFTSAPPTLGRDQVDLALIQRLVDDRGPGGLRLYDADWVSAFQVHTRHAAATRRGRVFLAGDAAHIHSPAGGQGLNTGVTDAHNLAWKLALAWHGNASAQLLDSYQPERAEVAAAVLRQADMQTKAWLLKRRHQVILRDAAMRVASALRVPEATLVPWLAGLKTVYPAGPAVVAGRYGGFTPGALVPDKPVWDTVRSRRLPLRRCLDGMAFTLILTGDADVREITERFGDLVRVRTLSGGVLHEGTVRTGRSGVVVLVRPDQHVGICRPAARVGAVAAYLERLVRPATRVLQSA